MKCPQCGQWNRASFPRCVQCGCELSATGDAPGWKSSLKDDKAKEFIRVDEYGDAVSMPDEREVLAQEMQELKVRKQEGQELQRQMQQRLARPAETSRRTRIQREEEPVSVENRPAPGRRAARIMHESNQPEPPKPPEQRWSGTEWNASYDPISEATMQSQRHYSVMRQSQQMRLPSRHERRLKTIHLLSWMLLVCVVLLVVLVGYQAVQLQQEAASDRNRASVTASIVDDNAAHTILIPGEDGQQIYIKELHTAYVVTGGFATIELADHIWYDDAETLTSSTMSVTLTPYVKTASGKQKPLDTITYDITIPLSPITLVSPDSLYTEVTTAMYSMQLIVRPGSSVYINGKNVSDTVSAETGELTYNATVQPKGTNTFLISVRSQYCRENTLTVELYREEQEIPLDLAADTYTSTSESSIAIRATTLPGATVDILTPHTDLKITNLDTTGEFSFMAVFDHIGSNTISITASYPGKKTSQVDYVMYYVPNQDVYTRKAWPLNKASDYSELMGNIRLRAERTQIYEVVGTIAEIVSEKPQMAIIYTSEDGKSRPVLLENKSKTNWKVGDYFRIYADVYGSYDAMPWLIARYTYK